VVAPPEARPIFRWAAGFSDNPDLGSAVREAASAIRASLKGASPDLAVIFCSAGFLDHYAEFPALVHEEFGASIVVGTTGMGVIGVGREVEERPAISISAGTLPGVHIAPFEVSADKLEELDVSPKRWADFLKVPADETLHFLIFGHPFTMPIDDLVGALDQAFPAGRKVGGLASGGHSPDTMALFLGDKMVEEGAVGVALWGDLDFDVIVAQGCRPVGPIMKVTKAAGSEIFEVDGEHAYSRMMAVLNSLPEGDRMLARRALFIGVAMNDFENQGQVQYDGGYLIRNLMGADPVGGVVRVGHTFHAGQTIRLQVRDAATAEHELSSMLQSYRERTPTLSGAAAFMFQCNGRGTNLFGEEGHDARLFEQGLGTVPLAGFFCNGEIGPVGEVTYIHGYTSSIGILRPRPAHAKR